MPRLRKLLLNRHVAFVTTTVEEGLPYPPNALIKAILLSALGRAQSHYRVRICHFLFENNHLHMIILIENPADLVGFMERFKTESAHAINRLLGKKKHTLWCEGYDSPLLLTPESVIDKIVYIYTNPAKDNLEDSVDLYPGLSSWKAFLSGKYTKKCPWIRRDELFPLNNLKLSVPQYLGLARRLKNRAVVSHTFKVEPDAWLEAFGMEQSEARGIKKEIIEKVRVTEASYRKERLSQGKAVIGASALTLQPIDTPYIPNRSGRKTWCISSDVGLRKEFIRAARALAEKAREVYERWKCGDFSEAFPLGLFAPSMPKLAEPLALC